MKNSLKTLAIATAALMIPQFVCAQAAVPSNRNERVVLGFIETLMNRHEVDKAFDTYVGAEYIQHNPMVPTGVEAGKQAFRAWLTQMPNMHYDVKRIISEGNYVVIHAHATSGVEGDKGLAVFDLFRLERGKVVEHWDAVTPVSATPANNNTQF